VDVSYPDTFLSAIRKVLNQLHKWREGVWVYQGTSKEVFNVNISYIYHKAALEIPRKKA
jgi:hypothetical protein